MWVRLRVFFTFFWSSITLLLRTGGILFFKPLHSCYSTTRATLSLCAASMSLLQWGMAGFISWIPAVQSQIASELYTFRCSPLQPSHNLPQLHPPSMFWRREGLKLVSRNWFQIYSCTQFCNLYSVEVSPESQWSYLHRDGRIESWLPTNNTEQVVFNVRPEGTRTSGFRFL